VKPDLPAAREAIRTFLAEGAAGLLRKSGSFAPFAAVRDRHGQMSLVATYLHADDSTPAEQHFALLLQILGAERKRYDALGICSDVNSPADVPDAHGAIQVNVESSDGVAEMFVQPYALDADLRLLAPRLETGEPLIYRRWRWPWARSR